MSPPLFKKISRSRWILGVSDSKKEFISTPLFHGNEVLDQNVIKVSQFYISKSSDKRNTGIILKKRKSVDLLGTYVNNEKELVSAVQSPYYDIVNLNYSQLQKIKYRAIRHIKFNQKIAEMSLLPLFNDFSSRNLRLFRRCLDPLILSKTPTLFAFNASNTEPNIFTNREKMEFLIQFGYPSPLHDLASKMLYEKVVTNKRRMESSYISPGLFLEEV